MKKRFNWEWIKNFSKVSESAAELVHLSRESETEPHRFSGRRGILQWIEDVEGNGFHKNTLNELQLFYFFELDGPRSKYNQTKTQTGLNARLSKNRSTNSKVEGFFKKGKICSKNNSKS